MNRAFHLEDFLAGVSLGVIALMMIIGMTATAYDPDLQKIQRQRNAMRLYEEASK